MHNKNQRETAQSNLTLLPIFRYLVSLVHKLLFRNLTKNLSLTTGRLICISFDSEGRISNMLKVFFC